MLSMVNKNSKKSRKKLILLLIFLLIFLVICFTKYEEYYYNYLLNDTINEFCQEDMCILIDFKLITEKDTYAVGDMFRYSIKLTNVGNKHINSSFILSLTPKKSLDPFPEGKDFLVELEKGQTKEYPSKEAIFPQTYTFREIGPHHFTLCPEQYTHFIPADNPTGAFHGCFHKLLDVTSYGERFWAQRMDRLTWVMTILTIFMAVVSTINLYILLRKSIKGTLIMVFHKSIVFIFHNISNQ